MLPDFDSQPTILVKRIPEHDHALLMIWERQPVESDIQAAFAYVRSLLDIATAPMHILVDIQRDPHFPVGITLNAAFSVHHHDRMGNWLVVGKNPMAKFIARALTSVGRQNIHWFHAMDDAMAYLQTLSPLAPEQDKL